MSWIMKNPPFKDHPKPCLRKNPKLLRGLKSLSITNKFCTPKAVVNETYKFEPIFAHLYVQSTKLAIILKR
jgi:hypothetical protein